jgi:hypothetical protein
MLMRQAGYYSCSGPDGVEESNAFTCAHCQKIIIVPPKADVSKLGGYCTICGMKMICPACVATGTCDPFEEKLKRMEAAGIARRSYEQAS